MEEEPVLNLWEDLREFFLAEFRTARIRVDVSLSASDLALRFYSLVARRIFPRKREIVESTEFHCPKESRFGYKSLCKKIVRGWDVNEHLSERIADPEFQDLLLWDWGIHHFHLGQVINGKGFANRTGPLLFAFVTDERFHSIQVMDHSAFCDDELVKIIHRNWPELLGAPFPLMPGEPLTAVERKALRKVGMQAVVEVGQGKVYGMIGGGYSSAGTSDRAYMHVVRLQGKIHYLDACVREGVAKIREELRARGLLAPRPLTFKLVLNERGAYVQEVQTNAIIGFPESKW